MFEDPDELRPSAGLYDYITTLPDVDAHKEWKVYYQKFNLGELKHK